MRLNYRNFRYSIYTVATIFFLILIAHLIVWLTSYQTTFYSDNLEIRKYWNGEQLFSTVLDLPIGPKLSEIAFNNNDTLVPYRNDNRWGYFTILTGKEIIDAKAHNFLYAFPFARLGLAAVVENDSIRFIDRYGSVKIKTRFPYIKTYNNTILFEDDALAVIPCYSREEAKIKYSLIDTTGKVQLSNVTYISTNEKGFRIFEQNSLYGVIGSGGVVIVDCIYDAIQISELGYIVRRGSKQQILLGLDFSVLDENVYDNIEPIQIIAMEKNKDDDVETQFSYSKLFFKVEVNAKFGACDKNGKLIIPCTYSDIYALNDSVLVGDLYGKVFLFPII